MIIRRSSSETLVYAFIDSQNLNLSIRDQGWRLDYAKFIRYLQDKYHVQKTYLFLGYVQDYEMLYARLKEQGYTLIFKPTLKLPNGKVKGNVDAELVLHTMIEMPNFNRAVIVSNDGDFYCLVDYLLKKNKLERLLIPNRNKFSSLLREFMSQIHFMNQLKGRLEYKKERH